MWIEQIRKRQVDNLTIIDWCHLQSLINHWSNHVVKEKYLKVRETNWKRRNFRDFRNETWLRVETKTPGNCPSCVIMRPRLYNYTVGRRSKPSSDWSDVRYTLWRCIERYDRARRCWQQLQRELPYAGGIPSVECATSDGLKQRSDVVVFLDTKYQTCSSIFMSLLW